MTELTLFLSSALVVFALGLQQLNVQGNHYLLAIITSYGIGALNLFIWHAVPHMTWSEIAATLNGGPVGIVLAMWAHPRLIRWMKRQPKDEWEFGFCHGRIARRHKRKGNVQFILWKPFKQGHVADYWHDFDSSWWPQFIMPGRKQ